MKRLPLVVLLIAGIASAQGPNPFGNGSGSGAPAPTTPAPTTPAPTTPAPTTPAPAPTGTPVPTGSPAPTGTPVPNEQPNAPGLGAQQAVQLSPEDLEQLKDVEAEYDQFVSAADDHDKRMRAVARREYDDKTAELEKRYADRI